MSRRGRQDDGSATLREPRLKAITSTSNHSHLERYVDEQVFRFNTRKDGDRKITDCERLAIAMSQIAGKRLTYAEVTGKTGSEAFDPYRSKRGPKPKPTK